MNTTNYDATEIWNTELEPLATEIVDTCKKHNIPCLLFAAVKNDDDHTEYVSKSVLPENLGTVLFKDHISDFVDLLKHIPPTNIEDIKESESIDALFSE